MQVYVEIRLISENDCCHSVLNISDSHILYKVIRIKRNYNFAIVCVCVCMSNIDSQIKRRKYGESVREWGAEEDVLALQ